MNEINKQLIDDYVTQGINPGALIKAILSNDLDTTVSEADIIGETFESVIAMTRYIRSKPDSCKGERARVEAWIRNANEDRYQKT